MSRRRSLEFILVVALARLMSCVLPDFVERRDSIRKRTAAPPPCGPGAYSNAMFRF